jgi:hypothetical protein
MVSYAQAASCTACGVRSRCDSFALHPVADKHAKEVRAAARQHRLTLFLMPFLPMPGCAADHQPG